jgi:hypothetical protein
MLQYFTQTKYIIILHREDLLRQINPLYPKFRYNRLLLVNGYNNNKHSKHHTEHEYNMYMRLIRTVGLCFEVEVRFIYIII